MDSALVVNQVSENINCQENDENIKINYFPGTLSNVRERLIAISPAILIGIIMGGLGSIIVSMLVSSGCLLTYASYRKVKKVEEVWPKDLIYYLALLVAIIPVSTQWWVSILGGILITLYWVAFKDKATFNLSLAIWLVIAFLGGANQIFGSKMQPEQMPYFKMYIANTRAGIGEYFLPAVIAGGTYLLYKRIINWTVVLSFVGTVVVLSFIGGDNPMMHFLSGTLVLGVMFLTPDLQKYSKRFKIVYGICGGGMALGIRFFGDFLTAVPLAILIMDWILVIKLDSNHEELPNGDQRIDSKGWVLFILASLGLVSSIFIANASPVTELFKSFNILSKFFMIILFYLVIQKLSSPRYGDYNLLQLILSILVLAAVIL